ncbi:MAG TPA: RDD family protein [Tepidisphaeraceae bacterium]|jgi:uncharacterized RDD family membrane protein YckC|nr:RDD family protein [Tepidisphaeraceae bacterium]
MSKQWYYARGGQQAGPVGWEQLQHMATAGTVLPTDLFWSEGMSQWTAGGTLPGLFGGAQPPPGAIAAISYYAAGQQVAYAGFWLRFVAAIVDGILLAVICFVVGLVAGFLYSMLGGTKEAFPIFQVFLQLLGLGIEWLYFALFESGPKQATPGKSMLGLRVTDLSGQRISFARASGRFFGKIISSLILMIGYVMAGFTERKQALHDIMAGTLVVKADGFRVV